MHPSLTLRNAGSQAVRQGAKRDPELYILGAVMAAAIGGAGYYFGRKPTTASSEDKVINVAKGSSPWEEGASGTAKYKYHPGGDSRNPPRDAPSALHSVVVPNVNLPKELHEKYNKWGKEGF